MAKLEFNAVFGDEIKKVSLIDVHIGAGGYQVLVDNYYQGNIFKKNGRWHAHVNDRSELTQDDIDALGERIDQDEEG